MINLALAQTDVMVFFRPWTSAVMLSAEMMCSTYRLFKTSSTSTGYLVLKFCKCNLKVPASKKGDENQQTQPMTPDLGIEPWLHFVEARSLTTAPSLHP